MADYKKPSTAWRNRFTTGRLNLSEDMVFSSETNSMNRGKRRAARTEVCRPCLLWREDFPDDTTRAVVLNLNRYGFLLRTLEPFRAGETLSLQLMRDDDFRFPLSGVIKINIVHVKTRDDGFYDHGAQTVFEKAETIVPSWTKPLRQPTATSLRRRPTRMYLKENNPADADADKNRRKRGF